MFKFEKDSYITARSHFEKFLVLSRVIDTDDNESYYYLQNCFDGSQDLHRSDSIEKAFVAV